MEQKQYEVLCGFMDHLTKGYNWYYDTPERRFEHSSGSIWLINPETQEWVIELEKGGKLWWNWDFHPNFQRYFNMERSDFEKFIKVWVEDVLNRGVSTTGDGHRLVGNRVEDVLNRGVSTTVLVALNCFWRVEDVLNRGVSTTGRLRNLLSWKVEDVLNHGKTIQ